MRRWKKYAKTFAMGLQNAMQYRINFALSLLSCLFPIVIQIFLWNAVFNSHKGSDVYGYSEGQIIAYAIMAALFSKMVATGFEYEIATDVKNGQLSKFVVQPIRYAAFRLCTFLGEKMMHLAVIAVVAAIIVAVMRDVIPLRTDRILVCLAALVLSVFMNFFIYYCLSMISFWLLEVWGIFLTFSLLANIASGGVFPLDMFGDTAQVVLNWLPFKYIVYFPVSVLLGKIPFEQMVGGLGFQLLWIAVLTAVSMLLWRTGMKKYESAGG